MASRTVVLAPTITLMCLATPAGSAVKKQMLPLWLARKSDFARELHSPTTTRTNQIAKEFRALLTCSRTFVTPLLKLPDFSVTTIFDDLLRVAHRGFSPDLLASALLDVFGGGDSALRCAFDMAHAWSRAGGRKCELSCDEFTIGADEGYPTLYAKGHDCKVLVFWLAPWARTKLPRKTRLLEPIIE